MAALSSAAFTPLAVTLDGDRAAEEIKKEKIRRATMARLTNFPHRDAIPH